MNARLGAVLCALSLAWVGIVAAQQPIDTAPSRQTLEEASRDSCDGVSEVVRRCTGRAAPPPVDDSLTRSRAATKAAFDRRDRRAREAALQAPAADGSSGPSSGPERLGGVTVTGTTDAPASLEDTFRHVLNPAAGGVPGPNGTTSTYAPDGVRYDCIVKCIGPACCATVRTLPNPARDSNGIGR